MRDEARERVSFAGPILALWQPARSAASGFLEQGEGRRGGEPLSLPVSCGAARTAEPGTAADLFKTICFYHLSLLIHKHTVSLDIGIKNLL